MFQGAQKGSNLPTFVKIYENIHFSKVRHYETINLFSWSFNKLFNNLLPSENVQLHNEWAGKISQQSQNHFLTCC